ncbi:MAG: hypothetical protein QXG00_00320 [Candidatus Woesearchaeota archaeon]
MLAKRIKRIKKRGTIELQFNWIFVLISGAIIFIFLLVLINSIKSTGLKKIDITVLHNIDNVLRTAQESSVNSEGTFRIIEMYGTPVVMTCDRDDISTINIKGYEKSIESLIIFSKSNLKGNIYAWTVNWNIPMLAGSFLMLADDRTQFVFVGNDPEIIDLYNTIPLNKTKKLISSLNGFSCSSYDNCRLIFYKTVPDSLPSKSTAVIINPDSSIFEHPLNSYGTIQFKDGFSTKTSFFLKKESIYGAIFSENTEYYVCTMRKALKRLRFTATILLIRANEIESQFNNNRCQQYYVNFPSYFNQIKNSTDELSRSNAATIYSSSQRLEKENEDLSRASCPTVY